METDNYVEFVVAAISESEHPAPKRLVPPRENPAIKHPDFFFTKLNIVYALLFVHFEWPTWIDFHCSVTVLAKLL